MRKKKSVHIEKKYEMSMEGAPYSLFHLYLRCRLKRHHVGKSIKEQKEYKRKFLEKIKKLSLRWRTGIIRLAGDAKGEEAFLIWKALKLFSSKNHKQKNVF